MNKKNEIDKNKVVGINKSESNFITIALIILLVVISGVIYLKYKQSVLAHNKIISDNLVTSGNGLYEDTYETGLNASQPFSSKYHFRGKHVNNYLMIDNKCFRVINISQNHSIKVIYIGKTDNNNCDNITSENLTVKWDDLGKNNWDKSSVKKYLINWLKENNLENSPYIVNDATWYIGGIKFISGESLTNDIRNERNSENGDTVTDNALVGLINASDYMKANETPCLEGAWRSDVACGSNNYLYTSDKIWTINKTFNDTERVWAVENGVMESKLVTNELFQVNPVVYLKSNLELKGNGTITNPYIIVK